MTWRPPAVVLLTLTALFWSGNMVTARAIHGDVPPFALAFWRWTLALLCVWPLAAPHWNAQRGDLFKAWRLVIALGVLGVGGYNTLAYVALQFTTATHAVLLNAFIPMGTLVLTWFFLHKPVRLRDVLSVMLSFAGALYLISHGQLDLLRNLDLNPGDLWMCLAVLVWSIYTLLLQKRPASLHPMLLLAATILVGIAVIAPFYLVEILSGQHIQLSWPAITGIAYVGIFPSFLGYLFYNRGVAEIGPARASLFIHLMPVFGTLLAVFFLGEEFHPYHAVGMTLIFSGLLLNVNPLKNKSGKTKNYNFKIISNKNIQTTGYKIKN